MYSRQIAAAAVSFIIFTGVVYAFFKRRQINASQYFGRPGFILGWVGLLLTFIISMVLATPIQDDDMTKLLNVMLIIMGILEAIIGGFFYALHPSLLAEHISSSVHVLYMQQLAASHVAIGITLCVVGARRTVDISIIILICLWGWLRVGVHVRRGICGPKINTTHINEQPKVQDLDAGFEASLFSLELIEALYVPLIFVCLYLSAA